jgi:hypothetical protein
MILARIVTLPHTMAIRFLVFYEAYCFLLLTIKTTWLDN